MFTKKILFNLSYKNIKKQVTFHLKFKTETINIYIQCKEYKMKYNGDNKFSLCTNYLLKNEKIHFIIKNDSYNSKIKSKTLFQSLRNNTALMPTKIEKENELSLIINSNQNDNNNFHEILSFYLNINIGHRFKFQIKIESQIKLFDYEFRINYSGLDGFSSQSLCCPLNSEEFDILINTNHNREFSYIINIEDKYNNIKKIEGEKEGTFFNFKKIKYKILLKRKVETKVKLICEVNGKKKRIEIYFKNQNECSNFGILNFEDNMKLDESCYFCFYINEIDSKGLEKEKIREIKKKAKNMIDFKCKSQNKNIKLQKMDISLIQYPKNNIQEIINFYNRISEFSFLFPIYYNKDLNPTFDSNEAILKNNFFILLGIYNELIEQRLANNYYQNLFFKEMNEFMLYFNKLLPSIDIQKKKEGPKNIQKTQNANKKEISEENEEEDISEENIEDSFERNKLKDFINSGQNENKYFKKVNGKIKKVLKINMVNKDNINNKNKQITIKNNNNQINDLDEKKKDDNIDIEKNAKSNQNCNNILKKNENKNNIINNQINENIMKNQINNIPINNDKINDKNQINNNNFNDNNNNDNMNNKQINNNINNENPIIKIEDSNNNNEKLKSNNDYSKKIHNENKDDLNDDKNNQILKENDKEDIKKENKEKLNLQDNYKDIDLDNNQNFNFEKDIWKINKLNENPQLRNNNSKDFIDISQFEKEGKINKKEESPKANTKNELKEIMANQILVKQKLEKKKSYLIKQFNKFLLENDDQEKSRIFEEEDYSHKSKRVFDIESFNNDIYNDDNMNYHNSNTKNNIDNNNDNNFNTKKNNINNNNIIIKKKKEKNIFIDQDLNFIDKIKYFNNQKDSFAKKSNNNFIFNNNAFSPEDISDIRHDFEKDIKYENQNTINEKDDNDLKQYLKYKNSITINYNPEIQTAIKKDFDLDTKSNLLEINISFENEDLFNPLDETLVNKIIKNINKGDKDDGNYKIGNLIPPIEPQNLCKDNNNNDEYLIKNLIAISKPYIISFFELFSRITIDFSNIAFCFILDCSLYLGFKKKLEYLMYILSIIKIIQMLNIKFCIFLSADDNYKVLIKKYDEFINYEDLIERIYETYIIKRFRNNLLKSVQIAIESLKCNDRENIIFLIFSDSLDDSIINFNYWKSNILINKNNSFIFFISKHSIAKNKQEIITNMWNNFEKKANENSNSKIKIIQSLEKEIVFKNIEIFFNT